MSYMDIENLYKAQEILAFRRCYAMEKIHGTSAHVSWKDGALHFFAGGTKQEHFEALFNREELASKATAVGSDFVVFGEAYGGKCQGMSKTYGKELRFVAFEALIGESWLAVPQADEFVKSLGLEFVHWVEISTDLAEIDAQRDAPSEQAFRNGMAERDKPETHKKREGIVLRSPFEARLNNGRRIIAKHKSEEFQERVHQPSVSPDKLQVLSEGKAIADEWVTDMRLTHVLQGFPEGIGMEKTGELIAAMVADIAKEARGEVVDSPAARAAIGRATALLWKSRLKAKLT